MTFRTLSLLAALLVLAPLPAPARQAPPAPPAEASSP